MELTEYWNWYLDNTYRRDLLEDNYNFYMTEEELLELLKTKYPYWNLTYQEYLITNYNKFLSNINLFFKKLTSIEEDSTMLKIWANHKKVKELLVNGSWDEFKFLKSITKLELINNKNFTLYRPKDYQEVIDILNEEFFLLDTETTGFTKLSQIIEFWWILYNRKASLENISEIRAYWLKNQNSILYLYNFLPDRILTEKIFEEIKDIASKEIDLKEKQEELFNYFQKIYPNPKLTKEIVWVVNDFNFKFNRLVHFYIKPYKDVSSDSVLEVHNIPIEKTIKEWLEAKEVVSWLKKFLENKIIIWHNVSFDYNKIAELFNDFDTPLPKINKVIDSISLFQQLLTWIWIGSKVNKYSLDYMIKLFLWIDMKNVEEKTENDFSESNQRHTAVFDVKLTHQTLLKAVEYIWLKDNELEIQRLLKNIKKEDKKKLKMLEESIKNQE